MQHAHPGVRWDDDAYTVPPGGAWVVGRALAALYVAVALMAGVSWIWATAVPGVRWFGALASICAFLAIGAIWIVCAGITVWRVATKRARRPGWYLFVVPAICLGLIVATVLSLPLRGRFEFVRSDFDAYAQGVLQAAEGVDRSAAMTSADGGYELLHPDVPDSIGGFPLQNASIVPEGLIIFDTEGAFLDDAGFAYLPGGKFPPGNGSFEGPRFRSLGGGWYAFTSSW